MTTPTGLTVTGSPITTSGTLALALASGYVIPTQAQLDAKQDDLNGTGIVKSTAGVISYLTDNTANWDTAYSRSLTSAAVTGTTTKTLTLNEQGGATITATWSDYDTAPVTSVFGRTGAITAQSGDYTTLLVPENTNLYFTNQRARYAISGDATSGVVYSNTTGIIALDDIPNTSLLHDSITVNGYVTPLGGTVTLTTTDVAEGTNLYYTQARFNSAFAAKTTTDLAEGTNLYFTNARAQAAITGTTPISVVSGNVSISQVGASINGYLSSTDWNTFNNKQNALTLTVTGNNGSATLVGATLNIPTYTLAGLGGISLTGLSASSPLLYDNTTGNFSIQVANVSQNGYLSSTDWSTFNSKQAALNGTGFVKISGTTISYDNSTYLTTISGIAAGGELSGTYANPSLVNSAVTGKLLTGVNITGGTIQDTDSILTGFGKLQNQINGLIGGSIYKGTWNASTNNPTLTSSVGTAGWYYIVNVAGSTNLNGITDWNVGDWAIFNGGVWQKVDNTDAVVSVNGFTGAVSLTTSNISEGTNLYYTDTRARASVSAGTGISYSSSTGVITNSAPDQTVSLTGGTGISTSGSYPNFTITNTAPDQTVSLTGAGTTSISGTYPNFTITSNDQYTGTVTSVGITESSAALSITGSPVTTSGNINIGFAGNSTQYVAGDGSLVTFPTVVTQAQNLVTEVYNSTGATLTKGTIVYINGGQGNLPTVTKALATSDATSAQTYGIVRTDITNMNNGYVTVIGNLENIDTQAYAAGTQLYLSGTTAGAWTDVKPYAPIHLVYVGIVVRSHPTQGVIEVKIQNGFELDELHNVSAQSPNNGDILQYNSSTSLWTSVAGTTSNITEGSRLYYTDARARAAVSLTTTGNNGASTYNSTTGVLNVPTYTLAGLGGINLTSISATSPLLYNNTTGVFSIQQASGSQAGYLSSADWTTFNSKQSALTNPVTGTGTSNYISKFTGTSTLGNSLIYDDGTNVGIGTNAPFSGIAYAQGLQIKSTSNNAFLRVNSGTYTGMDVFQQTDGNAALWNRDNGYIQIGTNNTARMTITAAGNIGIGTTTPSDILHIAKSGTSVYNSIHWTNPNSTADFFVGIGGSATANSSLQNNAYLYNVGNSAIIMATNDTERMRISGSGLVGIGTSSPIAALHVYSSNQNMASNIATSYTNAKFRLEPYNNSGVGISMGLISPNVNYLQGVYSDQTTTAPFVMQPYGGNVGIGTTNPDWPLTIKADASANAFKIIGRSGGDSAIAMYGSDASTLYGHIDVGTSYFQIYASNSQPMQFYAGGSERMRITSSGNVGIGTTPTSNVNGTLVVAKDGAYPADVNPASLILCGVTDTNKRTTLGYDTVNNYGYIVAGQLGVAWTSLYLQKTGGAVYAGTLRIDNNSDQRFKRNITSVENALDTILKLQGRKFNMIDEDNILRYGFIAQEVQPHLSDFVTKSEREHKDENVHIKNLLTLETSGAAWAALLVEAIKEQQALIQELSAKVSALENKS